jgi:hypothetical protein
MIFCISMSVLRVITIMLVGAQSYQVKENVMGRVRSTHQGGEDDCVQGFRGKDRRKGTTRKT